MNNVFTKTLFQKRHMMLGWFIGIMAVTMLTMSVYHSFSSGEIGQSLQSLPPAIQKLAGDIESFQSIGGYIAQQIFALRAPVLLIILSIALLVGLTAGEEQQGLTETHASLPLSRSRLLLQKLAAAATIVAIASAGTFVGVILSLLFLGETFSVGTLLQYVVNAGLIGFCYGLVGFFIGAATGKRALALGISSGFAFVSFIINSMAPTVSALETLDKLTLLHYYQTSGDYSFGKLAVLLLLAAVLVAASLVTFNRRDIRS